jgi:ribosomal protein S10
MQSQLRIYSIKQGLLDEFVEFWRAEIVPLRRRFGFEVAGAWAEPETRTFAWVLRHPDFERAAADYYDSPDRRELSRDPGEFIDSSELRMMDAVDAG